MHAGSSHVAIILTTYNSEKFLAGQLQSIAQQTHTDWHLIATDDGSTDGTPAMLAAFAKDHPVTILEGPRQGFEENFMAALFNAGAAYDYYAFADHDDIWDADKIAQGVKALAELPKDMPALYGSRTRLMDTHGRRYGMSQAFKGPFGFRNALVQCYAGGNTMMINRAAWELLRSAKKMPIVSHDWWFYQLISGAGGHIIFDPKPQLDYRQHGSAIAGSSAGVAASIARIGRLFKGQWRQWNDLQVAALEANAALLTETNRERLACFAMARRSGFTARLIRLHRSGACRQTGLGNVGMFVAAVCGRI